MPRRAPGRGGTPGTGAGPRTELCVSPAQLGVQDCVKISRFCRFSSFSGWPRPLKPRLLQRQGDLIPPPLARGILSCFPANPVGLFHGLERGRNPARPLNEAHLHIFDWARVEGKGLELLPPGQGPGTVPNPSGFVPIPNPGPAALALSSRRPPTSA